MWCFIICKVSDLFGLIAKLNVGVIVTSSTVLCNVGDFQPSVSPTNTAGGKAIALRPAIVSVTDRSALNEMET